MGYNLYEYGEKTADQFIPDIFQPVYRTAAEPDPNDQRFFSGKPFAGAAQR